MTSVYVVLCAWLVHRWLPPDPRVRLAALTGRVRMAPDERVIAWWGARRLRVPGQARTTLLLEMLMSELGAGLIPERAFVQVLGPAYDTPVALLTAPPTIDHAVWLDVAHVWEASNQAGFSMTGALRRIHAYALTGQEVTREVQATAAAPRFALLTVLLMPVVAWVLASGLGAQPARFLLHTPYGWACLATMALLDVAATYWMSRLAKRAMA